MWDCTASHVAVMGVGGPLGVSVVEEWSWKYSEENMLTESAK